MLDTDQLRSFLAIVDCGSFTKAAERVHKTQSAVSMHIRRLEEQLGCALFVKQGRGARLTAEGERLIEFARRIIQVEAGALAALSRKGLRGAVAAWDSGRLRRVVPGRDPCPLQPPSSAGRGVGRLRGVDRACSPRLRPGRSIWRWCTDLEGLKGLELLREEPLVWVAAEGFRIEEGTPIPLALGSATCRLAAGDRARRWSRPRGVTEDAVLFEELHRDRHARARRACGDDPPRFDGRPGLAGAGASRGPAGTAFDPHGPYPCAGTADRGSERARRGDPRDHRRAGAPGRLTARARRIFSRSRPWFTFT